MLGLRIFVSGMTLLAIGAVSSAQAVPIEGNAPGAEASHNVAATFTFDDENGNLATDTLLEFDSSATGGNTQGFATIDTATFQNFSLDGLASLVGDFLTSTFSAFPGAGTNPDFDDVDQGGSFRFDVSNAAVTMFNDNAGLQDLQTSFTIQAIGDIFVDYLSPPTEQFAVPASFSAVINGSSVNGSGSGSLSATLTTPEQFDQVDVASPAASALLFTGVASLAAFGLRRRRSNIKL